MTDPSILTRARRYCAFQERSHQELRDKLYGWGLHRRDVEAVIAAMIAEGYLNEERFAVAFAGGRFRLKAWGRVRIRLALRQKQVSESCIHTALAAIDDGEYRRRLEAVIRKQATVRPLSHPLRERQRLARYAIGKGFEPELVWDVLKAGGDD